VRILSEQLVRQQEAVDHSKKYLDLEQTRYDTGLDPYIDLAVAQSTLYGNQESLAALQIQQMTASVELIQALGGGWDQSQLPTAAQVTAKPARTDTTIQH
jgi:outer membrane protein TolC